MARKARGDGNETVAIGGIAGGTGVETAADSDDGTVINEQAIDPVSAVENGSGAGGEPVRRGRGRPKGSGNKARTETSSRTLGVDGVASILVSVHAALVMVSKCEELAISDEEAKRLAQASVNVAKLYDVEASEKAIAWTALMGTAGSIYLTRMFAIRMRLAEEARARKMQGDVVAFPGGAPIMPGAPLNGGAPQRH